jgi:hypothetical protein
VRGTGGPRRLAVTVAVVVLVLVGYAGPARADGELSVAGRSYTCSPTEAGLRTGSWRIASAVGTAGTVTAVSVSDGTATGAGPGAPVPAGGAVTVQFSVGAGPASVTLSLSVHWDDTGSGTPGDASVQDTIALNPCQPKPGAGFSQDCTGQVRVVLTNGSLAAHDAGGTAVFTVTGTGGYRQANVPVNAGATGTVVVPAAGAGHIQVSADGATVADVSAPYPGCAVPSASNRSKSPSPSARASASAVPSGSASTDPAGLAGTVAGPSPYPLPSAAPRAAGDRSAGRPFGILASVLVFLGIITGIAHWVATARLRRAGGHLPD